MTTGPFGDPMRWPAVSKFEDQVEGVSWDAQQSGLGFQRSISLWRTGEPYLNRRLNHLVIKVTAVKFPSMPIGHLSIFFVPAYSTVTQSRSFLPDVVGAVTWIAPYAPHHSTFVPVYASAPQTPSSLNAGTQCESSLVNPSEH